MQIIVRKANREEFEVFISKYQMLCNRLFDLVVQTVPIDELKMYCRSRQPDVMLRLTDTVLSSDIMREIVNECSITDITPLEKVIQHCNISVEGIGMIRDYQRSLDEYLSKLRARYLLGSSKDIVNAETIMFILHWIPDEASFPIIKRLLYKAFYHLNKYITFQANGKKILYL